MKIFGFVLVYALLLGAVAAFFFTLNPRSCRVLNKNLRVETVCFLEGGKKYRVYCGSGAPRRLINQETGAEMVGIDRRSRVDVDVPPGRTTLVLWVAGNGTNATPESADVGQFRLVDSRGVSCRGNIGMSGVGIWDVGTPAEGEEFTLRARVIDPAEDDLATCDKPFVNLVKVTYREKEKRRANE